MRRGLARNSSSFRTRAGFGAALALILMLGAAPAVAEDLDGGLNRGLMRLSEILGSVHHLREVCGANEGALWRNKMIDMMNTAALSAEQRQAMITHFNDAYYQARAAFPDCSAKAAAKANSLFDEAQRLAGRLSTIGQSATAEF
ncbi:MAG: TIGR02301 family protein [Parvibaculum sp.]|uniref:TIGR02301 family protein n=1 Tax=Parvibaculum sp. TaxID=2024848 RepID=UPI0025F79A00|nr:TIGR02301 family protein [Parvibaculum sp.]MCE9649913.1 TIGR02301 family protein [Parvibaculum sp.]